MAGWWNISEGDVYSKDDVVARCEAYIDSAMFRGNVAEKRQKIGMIQRKNAARLRFSPVGKGWGKSPLNHKCWLPASVQERIAVAEGKNKNGGASEKAGSRQSRSNNATGKPAGDMRRKNTDANLPDRDYTEQPQVNVRPWGAGYRAAVLRLWGCCAVTGCKCAKLLTASHILPVNQCNNEQEMQDPCNGIALTPTFDKLFDSGYISFSDTGSIIITSLLGDADRQTLGLSGGIRIDLPSESRKYMQYHREHVFKE